MYPRAGRELEVLGDAALEQETLLGPRRIVEAQYVTELVEAFLIKGFGSELFLAPVARRDARALQTRLVFSLAERHQLHVEARWRQPDVGRIRRIPHAAECVRRGLGRAEAGEEQDILAASAVRHFLPFVEHVLRTARPRDPKHLQAREEFFAQRGIVAEER